MIPKGVATLLREGTFQRREIEKEILSTFNSWGYQEVTPPLFEYLDIFSLGVEEEALDSAYKFVDRATGRIMVLRPDVTPQIARIAATLLSDQARPLRLCYSANVFRHEAENAGRERELLQIGGELIGPSDAEADAEMIVLTIEILRRIGLKSFRITLGQMEFTRGILSPFNTSPAFFKEIRHHVAKKEASALEKCLKREAVDAKTRKQVLSLLDLLGGEAVFRRAEGLSENPACQAGLQRLKDVYAILKTYGYQDDLLIDLGEVRGFDYYTGTIFEIFAEGFGSELGGGGRYDRLLKKFGKPAPSTGFALYIDRIQSALDKVSPNKNAHTWVDFFVLHQSDTIQTAVTLSAELRSAGFRVIRKNGFKNDKIAMYREEARSQKIKHIILFVEGDPKNRLALIDPVTGNKQIQNMENTLEWLRLNTVS